MRNAPSFKYNFLIIFLFFSNLIFSELDSVQKELLDSLPPDQRDSIQAKLQQADDLQKQVDEVFEEESTLVERPEEEGDCEDCIYGYDFFQFSPSTFAPSSNSPVSSNYILGPGDKLKINLYGSNENEEEAYVSREGVVVLPLLGPLNLMGMSFESASDFIKKEVSQKLVGTNASISLSQLRSISVYVLGEAYKPGKYTLSGLSSISNALFVSGGVNKNGSLRDIKVKRNNKIIANYDFYDFLLKGSINSEINLLDGDVIFIPFIKNKVKVGGSFKRPYIYEFVEGETVGDAMNFAGGPLSDVSYNASIELSSIDKESFKRQLEYLSFDSDQINRKLSNQDVINISSSAKVYPETIKLSGEFKNPGEYSILPGDTILDIINRAGGFTEQSYSEGAVFLRKSVAQLQKEGFERSADELENTIIDIISKGSIQVSQYTLTPISTLIARLREEMPLGRLVVDIDYLNIKTDPFKNFRVQGGDSLHVPVRPDSIQVVGEVLNASTLSYNPEFKTEDYINRSGGLNDSADPGRIFIIYPNGQSTLVKKSLFASKNNILPGSTIVIPRDARPLDAVNLTQIITPILADLATSAAAIAAINN